NGVVVVLQFEVLLHDLEHARAAGFHAEVDGRAAGLLHHAEILRRDAVDAHPADAPENVELRDLAAELRQPAAIGAEVLVAPRDEADVVAIDEFTDAAHQDRHRDVADAAIPAMTEGALGDAALRRDE